MGVGVRSSERTFGNEAGQGFLVPDFGPPGSHGSSVIVPCDPLWYAFFRIVDLNVYAGSV